MKVQRYTIVDICWTLFYSNTTLDFLDFAITDEAYINMRRCYNRTLLKYFNLVIYKLFRRDIMREKAVSFLRGKTREELQVLASDFYQQKLVDRKITPIWQLLPKHNIIIASGTLDIIASIVAQHLNADKVLASQLQYDNKQISTGRFKDFLFNKKNIAEQYRCFNIFTDNLTDIDLVNKSEYAYIVEYGNIQRWKKHLTKKDNIIFIHAEQKRY